MNEKRAREEPTACAATASKSFALSIVLDVGWIAPLLDALVNGIIPFRVNAVARVLAALAMQSRTIYNAVHEELETMRRFVLFGSTSASNKTLTYQVKAGAVGGIADTVLVYTRDFCICMPDKFRCKPGTSDDAQAMRFSQLLRHWQRALMLPECHIGPSDDATMHRFEPKRRTTSSQHELSRKARQRLRETLSCLHRVVPVQPGSYFYANNEEHKDLRILAYFTEYVDTPGQYIRKRYDSYRECGMFKECDYVALSCDDPEGHGLLAALAPCAMSERLIRDYVEYSSNRARAVKTMLTPQSGEFVWTHLRSPHQLVKYVQMYETEMGEAMYAFQEYSPILPGVKFGSDCNDAQDSCREKLRPIKRGDPLFSRVFLHGLQSMSTWRALSRAMTNPVSARACSFRIEVHTNHSLDNRPEWGHMRMRNYLWAIFVNI